MLGALWQASEMARAISEACQSTKTAPIELRVEVHHREAKMVYLNSQFDRSCLGALWQASEMAPECINARGVSTVLTRCFDCINAVLYHVCLS